MNKPQVLDIGALVNKGQLFRPDTDRDRIEAYLHPMGCENHGSNLFELSNGDLLCVWFSGDKEGAQNVSIAISRLTPDATQWDTPIFVSDDPTCSDQNPVLFLTPEGKLWLLYASQQSKGEIPDRWVNKFSDGKLQGIHWNQWTSVIRRRISDDNGLTWGPMMTLFDQPGSFCRNRMEILTNGDWLFPMYYSKRDGDGVYGNDVSVMQISTDHGQSWVEVPVPGSRGRVHPTVIELAPGQLVSFFRSRAADRIYVSHSNDYGRTWSEVTRTELPNNNASIQAAKLASGNLALAFNHLGLSDDPDKTIWSNDRYPLTIALSEDDGCTWPYMRHIDTSDGFFGQANQSLNRSLAYPSIMQGQDGRIHISYSYSDRQCIKYVCIQEDWVRDRRSSLFT